MRLDNFISCLVLPLLAASSPILPRKASNAQLSFHPAAEPNGVGILVLPGGGYQFVSLAHEGANATAYLNSHGYDAWVLNYSVADTAPTPLYPVPQDEAAEAVRTIRAQNRTSKLGVWGFSAGGHLAATTVTNPDVELDFGILAYAVITMDPKITHPGSRHNLIGDNATQELQDKTSAEKLVTDTTPPIFLFHTADDNVVPIENALRFSEAMAAKKRPFQSLILPQGPHGIALGLDNPKLNWMPELERWMKYSI